MRIRSIIFTTSQLTLSDLCNRTFRVRKTLSGNNDYKFVYSNGERTLGVNYSTTDFTAHKSFKRK